MRNTGSLSEFLDVNHTQKCLKLERECLQLPKVKQLNEGKGYKFKRWKTVLDEYTPSKKMQLHKSQPIKQQKPLSWKVDYHNFYRGNKDLSKKTECRVYLLPKIRQVPTSFLSNHSQEQKYHLQDSLLTELIVKTKPNTSKKFILKKSLQHKKLQQNINIEIKQNQLNCKILDRSKEKDNSFAVFRLKTEAEQQKGKVKKITKQRRIQLERSMSWARNRGKDLSFYQFSLEKNKIKDKKNSRRILQKQRKDLLKVIKKRSFSNSHKN